MNSNTIGFNEKIINQDLFYICNLVLELTIPEKRESALLELRYKKISFFFFLKIIFLFKNIEIFLIIVKKEKQFLI